MENLTIREKLKDKEGIANAYHDIGQVYNDQGISDKAILNYELCLTLRTQLNDKKGIAVVYSDLGIMYDIAGKYAKALRHNMMSLKIREEIKDSAGLPDSYINIGIIYKEQGDYNEALKYYRACLPLYQKTNYTRGIISYYYSIGEIYRLKRDFASAQTMLNKAIDLAHKIASKSNIRDIYQELSFLDSTKGNYKFAFQNYIKYISYRDSLINEESTKRTFEEQFKYDTEKREAAAKAEQDKKGALAASDKKRQQLIVYAVAGVLLIVIIFSALLYKRFRLTNKQKKIIEIKSKETEEQKHLIEEHQKEIIDSITYAKRLQQAILPTVDAVKEHLPNSFIYYQPKDIVAGDFYWMHTTNEAVYLAAADCTGHGVPGAMVSVVCSNALNRAVNEFDLTDTGRILDKTRELVIETFEKSDKNVKDGMDISLLRVEFPIIQAGGEIKIQWSGANNSLWYIINNELVEIKADKQPIGKYSDETPFKTNSFSLNSTVSFYLFSDGYADQFSVNDKKLMKKKFKDIVLSVQNLSMQEQKNTIEKSHIDWKGAAEQSDDVLVIGIKL
ncbi:MAG TPA: tetratricopeptide repeat protein [Bacteroidia bacterium]